jgi:YD repeat-containing protein
MLEKMGRNDKLKGNLSRMRILGVALLAAAGGSLLVPLLAKDAGATVSLKNGNFFLSYTDFVYPGGFVPKVERIYNSKSSYTTGMFGPGWGFEYEAYLNVSADGSVVVHEYGGGAENRFDPAAFNQAELDKAVDVIIAAARKAGAVASQEGVDSYRRRLKADANYRNEEWEKYRRTGKVQARQLAVGTKLQSNHYSYQFITRTQGGYVRSFETGKSEYYNDAGKLVRIQDKNGNFIALSYNEEGHLDKIVDNFNRRMFFHFNTKGRVDSIEGENNQKASYQYDGKGMLSQSKDTNGNVFGFKYDTSTNDLVPNMTEVTYKDGTNVKISYYGADKNESVRTYKDRDGTISEYTYTTNPSDAGNITVAMLVKGADGKKISSSKYEYFLRHKSDGEEWQYKLISTIDGDRTEATYNECCGLPLLINHNGEETSFQYDTKGHVVKKATPNEVTELSYDPTVGKVSKVLKYSKTDKKRVQWSMFKYDPKGNLIQATNSDRKIVRLFYNRNGLINNMVDQDRRQIAFKYDENGHPIQITDPALGTITVSYNNSGEIKKVESTAGRKIAVQVTSAFQNLLDIIRPAGVTLSF